VTRIHPNACVDPRAEIDPTAEIGPFAFVGPEVRLGPGVVLRPHAYVTGRTEIGAETVIYSFASIGEVPQDKKYRGEPTQLVIGARNHLREHVTISPGTAGGGRITTIGDDNFFLIGAHVGHDCHVGSNVVISNNTALGGHVRIEDYAVLGAASGIHQFSRIGESAMVAGMSGVAQDVAPFTIAQGNHARLLGVNRVNVERRGFDKARIDAIERAFRIVFRSKLLPRDAFAKVRAELPDSRDAEHMVAFLEKSERGFCRMR
jgi:UDP-N-acetylglucosamine acyltransferase